MIGVHGLVYLSHRQATASSEEMALNICTNPARVRKVMGKLKRAGLVMTREGHDGGYWLGIDPQSITLRAVLEAVGATAVSAPWRSGDPEQPCLIASGMAGIMDELLIGLNAICLNQLEGISIAEIARRIFAPAHEAASD